MSAATLIEIFATLFGFIYIVLLIHEKIACWPFSIVGSLLSIYLFLDSRLYSEALLYSFYVFTGFWGWIRWHQRDADSNNPVVRFSLPSHCITLCVASAFAVALGYFFASQTDAQRPYIDAFTTSFSFAATLMEVRKVLEAWLYWVVLNFVSIWLYQDRELDIYAMLIGVYAVLSVWGFVQWCRVYRRQNKRLNPRGS